MAQRFSVTHDYIMYLVKIFPKLVMKYTNGQGELEKKKAIF